MEYISGKCWQERRFSRLMLGKDNIYIYSCTLYSPFEKEGDAFYFTDRYENKTINRLLVISDGVGGWKKYKIDPGDYARELCKNISDYFHKYELSLKMRDAIPNGRYYSDFSNCDAKSNDEYSEKIAKRLMVKGGKATRSKGSGTCTVLLLDKQNGRVYSSYIGDSMYMILRCSQSEMKYRKEYKSEDQKHNITTPFQMSSTSRRSDNPEKDSITKTHSLQVNDIILLATDGLWDNLTDAEIIEKINDSMAYPTVNPQHIVNMLSIRAIEESKIRKGNKKKGGKKDDITIMIAQLITNAENEYSLSTASSTADQNEKCDELF